MRGDLPALPTPLEASTLPPGRPHSRSASSGLGDPGCYNTEGFTIRTSTGRLPLDASNEVFMDAMQHSEVAAKEQILE